MIYLKGIKMKPSKTVKTVTAKRNQQRENLQRGQI